MYGRFCQWNMVGFSVHSEFKWNCGYKISVYGKINSIVMPRVLIWVSMLENDYRVRHQSNQRTVLKWSIQLTQIVLYRFPNVWYRPSPVQGQKNMVLYRIRNDSIHSGVCKCCYSRATASAKWTPSLSNEMLRILSRVKIMKCKSFIFYFCKHYFYFICNFFYLVFNN